MFTFITHIPIFRRLFYAFLLAAVVPSIVIAALGVTFINTQNAHIQATNPIIVPIVIACLSSMLVVITIGYIVKLSITRQLGELTKLTQRIATGETEARAKILGHDEISTIATTMNNMLDNIVRLIQEKQSQRDVLQGQVEKLVSEVSGVGEGDLRVQAEVTTDALGVLADSFNYMVEELGSLVVRVKMVAHEVENSTATVLDRMTQLVKTGDIQIKQISDAAVEIEQTAESSRQVAERSQRLYNVARLARQDAQIGRASVQQAIEGMGRINENVQATAGKVQTLGDSSREINEIVEAISGIAHQTNRLALDAAIQAAMAGENGKGFGAVAADIRRLAERAKDQAGMIAHIVRSLREDIGAVAVSMQDTERETSTGTRLTQEAGIALESIFAAVEHQAREIEVINRAAVQQLNSSSAIVQIMHEVSEATQHSGLSTHDASQSMERLTRLVEQLRASVEAFKMRENQDYFINQSGVNEEATDAQLTFSGIFRTVSATAQPAQAAQLSGVAAMNNRRYEAPANHAGGYNAWEWGNISMKD
jgi:twitching motility protein PilJ